MRQPTIVHLVLAAFTALLSSSPAQAQNNSSLILRNGKIFTGNPAQPWAQAIAMNGRTITKVGSNKDVQAQCKHAAQVIDLGGRTVIPGLNNAHVHSFWASSFPRAQHVNNGGFIPGPGPSVAQIVDAVATGAASAPADTWLFGTIGANVVEDPSLDRWLLDSVAPDHPVLLFAWYGHGTYFNTRAMELLGLAADEPDPFAGFYERETGTNTLRGVAHEYAEFRINRYFAQEMTDAEHKQVIENFEQAALRVGFTSVQDYAVGLEHSRSVRLLASADPSLRWRSVCFPLALDEGCDNRLAHSPHHPTARVKASGIKWISDGTPIERLGFVTESYLDRPGWFGRPDLLPMDFEEVFGRALTGTAAKTQTHVHITGDANWDVMFETMSDLARDRIWQRRRVRIEHGDLMRPDHFADAKAKGVIVVQNPTHFGLAGLFHQRFASHIVESMLPFRSLVDYGIPIAIGTDGIGAVGDPFLDLFLAMIHPTRPSEALTLEQALLAYTQGGAYAEFEEGRKGVLAPGYLADIAVLSQDIFTLPPPAILGTQSVLTVVDGRVAYSAL